MIVRLIIIFFSVQDSELNELRKTIELLKKQNAVAQAAINGVINTPELTPKGDRTGTENNSNASVQQFEFVSIISGLLTGNHAKAL